MYFTLQYIRLRAYLKNHSRNLHILLCEKHFSNARKFLCNPYQIASARNSSKL